MRSSFKGGLLVLYKLNMFLRICFGLQNKYFFTYRDERKIAENFKFSGDMNKLQSYCKDQVNYTSCL
jgi:hypothetical protein